MPSREYVAVRDKVDAFTGAVEERRRVDLACREGCSSCCRVQLEVSEVEAEAIREAVAALDDAARERLAERADGVRDGDPCVMLEDGRCVIYDARPLVCRTQGHALSYPPDTLPPDAVRATSTAGEITWCPLNYGERPPGPEDVLDAERVDVLLAVVNRRRAVEPLARTPLARLARGNRR